MTTRLPYAFGDSDAALERLALLDQVFADPSHSILAMAASDDANTVIDVGCGPGFSTSRLRQHFRRAQIVGLDVSERYLSFAADHAKEGVMFAAHDVTVEPFPHPAADVLYARFVLAHVPQPEEVLAAWIRQVSPNGSVLVEDTERIEAPLQVLDDYEELAAQVVSERSADLYPGPGLEARPVQPGETKAFSRCYEHLVPVPVAARLFSKNLAVWRHDPAATQRASIKELDDLAAALDALVRSDDNREVLFAIRQLILRREDASQHLEEGPVQFRRD